MTVASANRRRHCSKVRERSVYRDLPTRDGRARPYGSLSAVPLSVVVHHPLRDVALVAERHRAAGSAVRAARAAATAAPVHVVGTRTVALIRGNRRGDDVLSDLRVRLLGLRPRGRSSHHRDEPALQRERAIAHRLWASPSSRAISASVETPRNKSADRRQPHNPYAASSRPNDTSRCPCAALMSWRFLTCESSPP